MRARHNRNSHWPTVQQTAASLNTTSAEICRLLKLGRLYGSKRKQPGRPGTAQWLINPKSIIEEKRRNTKRWVVPRASKRTTGSKCSPKGR
jgi:hypothetical protein